MIAKAELMDAVDFLKSLPPASLDLFLTDLAYESLEKHRNPKAPHPRLVKKWFKVFPNYRIPELMHFVFRALKPSRHAYFFCDEETCDVMKPAARAAGFHVWKSIVWNKEEIGMGYHWRNQHEFVLFVEKKPGRQLNYNNKDFSSLHSVKRVKNAFPTEKPMALLAKLIENSTAPGDLVCDTFSGSGSTAETAIALGRDFVGCDIDQDAVNLTRGRILKGMGVWRPRRVTSYEPPKKSSKPGVSAESARPE